MILPSLGRGVDSEVNEWFRHTHYKQTAAKLRRSYETNCGSAETLCFVGFRDYYPCWDSAVCTVPARVVPGQCKLHCLRLWRGHGNPWKTLEKQENDPGNRRFPHSGLGLKNASFADSCEENDPL